MSKLLILYNYNKYYNRIIKRLETFNDYLALITPGENTPAAYKGFVREKMNFDYQDGVYAQHVINIKNSDPQWAKSEHPDYCVLEESWTTGEGENASTTTKLSRYFILDVTKIRGNQFQLSLRRDLLADYYNNVLNAPVFIEKGWVQDLDDPAIFNKESMTVNQIKQGEILLNQTKLSGKGAGWVVGYLAREDTQTVLGPATGQAELPPDVPNYADLPTKLKDLLTAGEGYHYDSERSNFVTDIDLIRNDDSLVSRVGFGVEDVYDDGIYGFSGGVWSNVLHNFLGNDSYLTVNFPHYNNDRAEVAQKVENSYRSSYWSLQIQDKFNAVYESENEDDFTADFSNYHNTYFKGTDNKYYKIKITRDTNNDIRYMKAYTIAQCTGQSDALSTAINTLLSGMVDGRFIKVKSNANTSYYCAGVGRLREHYIFEAEEVDFAEVSVTISASRNKLLDAPYDMFCIPLGILDVKSSGSTLFSTALYTALAAARALACKGGPERINDIQILPYCPFPDAINSDGDIDLTGLTAGKDYSFVTNSLTSANVNVVLYPLRSKGTFDITLSSSEELFDYCIEKRDTILNKKMAAETQFARFVSPNFASMFDINVQKNLGIIRLNVDYFYKPYTPYLHIAPYFDGLYGQDFNDPKGLICAGDFSMATAASKWEEYQIQNKNFEEQFNRQIQNLDVNNSLAYQVAEQSSGIAVATSSLTGLGAGAASGAVAGSFAGPIGTLVGAVAGAVVGGVSGLVTSMVGRKYDLEYLKKSQSEARSYAVDMYAYNLGNIKALPNTLTKVSAFTENNKIFPFIEFYDCTSIEKEALTNKLRYNGMTIMRIGKIADFLGGQNYVSGQLIRLTGIDEDSHVVAEIAQEIKEGAYYYGTDSE